MIRLSVFYAMSEGATFDHDYYRAKHVPLCTKTWGLPGAEIDKGLDGPYVAAVHFKFDSPEPLQIAMASEGPAKSWLTWPTTPRSNLCCRRVRSSTRASSLVT